MKKRRFDRLFRELNTTARKVYEAVPIQESWTTAQIMQELYRRGVKQDLNIIQGALNTLDDMGLIKAMSNKVYQRVPVSDSLPDEEDNDVQEPEQVMANATPNPTPLDPFEVLAKLSERVRKLAGEVDKVSLELEQAALNVQAYMDQNATELNDLRQLKELLGRFKGAT